MVIPAETAPQERPREPLPHEGNPAHSPLPNALADPLIILGVARSFTSVVGTMLGRHPQMYGLPETNLFNYETLAKWWRAPKARLAMKHGLFRAAAELYYGGQTETAVRRAIGWLRRRLHLTTGALLEDLAEQVHPRILVEKSVSIAGRMRSMRRAYGLFPQARFVHLLRHPRGQGESVMKVLAEQAKLGPGTQSHGLIRLCSFPPRPRDPGQDAEPERRRPGRGRRSGGPPRRRREDSHLAHPEGGLDPQWGWYHLNRNILDFLEGVPATQVFRVRAEEIITNPDAALRPLAAWLGLRDDREAIDEMKHPERSPYACFGPPEARLGNNYSFLQNPVLRPRRVAPVSLEGPLGWRQDDEGFAPAVRRLAQELGYT